MVSNETFEIGLVGAGAISAGAYTGGVVDFMVLALDQWYAAKGQDALAPPHDVKLSTFAGASAGSITAAIAAGYLGSDQPSIRTEEEGRQNRGKNKLFDSWVDRIDISSLLETRDLARNKEALVASLLDSTVLMEIADMALDVVPRTQRRPYLAENFELLLTVTNLRGVPYAFQLLGSKPSSYDMSLHADHIHFRISDAKQAGLVDRYTMSWAELGAQSEVKQQIKLAAVASGAFPIGLAPHTLTHAIPGNSQPDWYNTRMWPIATPDSDPHQCVTMQSIPVQWGAQPAFSYKFQCVDGGVINNEPLELARRILASSSDRKTSEGDVANKAILLIDPFPSEASFDPQYKPAPDLLQTAMALFGALKNQARFKPEELTLAADKKVFSRFMVAPSRDDKTYAIACGSLSGFGGFLKQSFRAHDYFLGRRNMQKFLRDHFVLPENNPLFNSWTMDMREAYYVRNSDGAAELHEGFRMLPVIPLVGEARTPCHQAQWPEYTQEDLDKLTEQLERRLDTVFERLVKQYFSGNNWAVRSIAKLVLGRKKKDVVGFALKKVSDSLRKMELMRS